jgi:uncharacterized protein
MPSAILLGVSTDRRKFGNKSLRAHRDAGFDIFPIHPTEKVVEGITCYPSVDSLPEIVFDRVSIYLPPTIAIKALESLQAREIREVWLNPGVDTLEVIQEGKRLGLNLICGCSIRNVGADPADYDVE